MAYVQENDQNQNQQNPATNPGMSSSPASTGGSAPGGSSKGGAPSPQSAPAQPFQNLQAYLSANAPQVQAQADKIASNLTNQYGQITSDVNKAQSDFGGQVKAGYAAPNEELTNSAVSNPTDFVSKPENVKAFQALYNDSYTGPSNFESSSPYGELSKTITDASKTANNFNTLPGMQSYFQSQNPNATQGGNTLDSVLLSGNPGAQQTVRNAAKPFGTLNDYLNNATSLADKGAADANTEAQNEASGLQNKFVGEGGLIPSFQNEFNTNLSNARTDARTLTDKAMQDIKSHNPLTPEEAAALGVRPEDIASMGNLANTLKSDYQIPFDTSEFFQSRSPETVINPANFATKEDYSRAAALSQLTGTDLASFLNPNNAEQAGTAPKSVGSFNAPGAVTKLSNAIQEHDQSYLKQNPMPSENPAQKPLQMDLISRNPKLLDNPTWSLWYQRNGGGSLSTGPVLPPSGPSKGGNNPTGFGNGTIVTDPKTGKKSTVY